MLSQWQIRPTRQAVAPRLSDITTTAVKNAVEYFFQQDKKKKISQPFLITLYYNPILSISLGISKKARWVKPLSAAA